MEFVRIKTNGKTEGVSFEPGDISSMMSDMDDVNKTIVRLKEGKTYLICASINSIRKHMNLKGME